MALEPAAAGYDLVRDEYYFWVVWLITILEFFLYNLKIEKYIIVYLKNAILWHT